MEPFGLLNFLATLFPQAEQTQSTPPQNPTPPPPQTAQNTEPKQEPPKHSQNPCAEFLEAHERRARQTRR